MILIPQDPLFLTGHAQSNKQNMRLKPEDLEDDLLFSGLPIDIAVVASDRDVLVPFDDLRGRRFGYAWLAAQVEHPPGKFVGGLKKVLVVVDERHSILAAHRKTHELAP